LRIFQPQHMIVPTSFPIAESFGTYRFTCVELVLCKIQNIFMVVGYSHVIGIDFFCYGYMFYYYYFPRHFFLCFLVICLSDW